MLPDERDAAHLWSMVKPARYLVRKSAAITFEDLRAEEDHQYAITKALELIGEGARHVSGAFQAAHPEIKWSLIRGMRHFLVHEYERVDWPLVWETLRADIPDLLRKLEPLLPDLPSGETENNPL